MAVVLGNCNNKETSRNTDRDTERKTVSLKQSSMHQSKSFKPANVKINVRQEVRQQEGARQDGRGQVGHTEAARARQQCGGLSPNLDQIVNIMQGEMSRTQEIKRLQGTAAFADAAKLDQFLTSEKRKPALPARIDTLGSQILFQQNQLRIEQEKQEQMFRNIQLMQQSLQEKEMQRIKRKNKPNMDIPLHHNTSSASNKIKSNILQNYLQGSSTNNIM